MLAAMTRSSLGIALALGLGIAVLLVGCGDSSDGTRPPDAATRDGAPADTPAAGFTLTSPAFAAGGAIPAANTCSGANTSPQLTWSGAPSGTLSYAVVLTDLSLSPDLVHWVIYDIPSTETGLPASVENVYAPANVPGAHQTVSVHAPTVGYYGPCPPQPPAHSYELAVYALFIAVLPGATMQTASADAVSSITAHQLAHATLTGTYTK
jgi:Raf kinase inhibitor-like YbhB/YbcL family protein